MADLKKLASGKHALSADLAKAKRPVIIVGTHALKREDGAALHALAQQAAAQAKGAEEGWSVFNVLHTRASQVGALDAGYSSAASRPPSDVVFLLQADDMPAETYKDAFVVYIGSHGDQGAHAADVILPGAAYTEKDATFVNTEGRAQTTRRAGTAPGLAREDWKIVRALSEYAGLTLPYDDLEGVRARMEQIAPHLVRYDVLESSPFASVAAALGDASGAGKRTRVL